MVEKCDLKIDWATHKAAKYACENWHYSGCLPAGKLVKIGAWEEGKFIGVVLFGRGATPNLGKPYKLNQDQCVELTRIALTNHKNTVSKIMSISIKFLKNLCPDLKLIISFADSSQSHHGGVYQASNWIYNGQASPANFYLINGKMMHPRSIGAKRFTQNLSGARKIDKNAKVVNVPGKHRYLYPLDKETAEKIKLLAKPYPKRASSADSGTSGDQSEGGGAIPTDALHNSGVGDG